MKTKKVKHGLSYSLEYHVWYSMIRRCNKPNAHEHKRYKNRGIKVCSRWMGDSGLQNFVADMGSRPSKKHSLDRINNNGNYYPGNCRWATLKEQGRNRANNRLLKVGTVTKPLSAWAEETGLSRVVIASRISRGWSTRKAITTPPILAPVLTVNGVSRTYKEWADLIGVYKKTIRHRLKAGWSPEAAVTTPSLHADYKY